MPNDMNVVVEKLGKVKYTWTSSDGEDASEKTFVCVQLAVEDAMKRGYVYFEGDVTDSYVRRGLIEQGKGWVGY